MKTSVVLALLVALVCSCQAQKTTSDLDILRQAVELTLDDFNEFVLGSKFAWLLVFSPTTSFPDANNLAAGLEGLARVGYINVDEDEDSALIKFLGFESKKELPLVRGYKYMDNDKSHAKDFEDMEEGKNFVLESLPEGLVTEFHSMSSMEPFLVQAVQEAKMPVFTFTTKPGVPDLLKKLALWFDRFKFAVCSEITPEEMGQFQIEKLPSLLLMVPQPANDGTGKIGFGMSPYDRKQFGGLKFRNVVRFLATAQVQLQQQGLFPEAPETSDEQQVPREPIREEFKAEDLFEMTAEKQGCGKGTLGLCIIGVIDASVNNLEKDNQLEILREVQNSAINKGRVLHFMWVDAICHPSFLSFFDSSAELAPGVIAVSASKKSFVRHIGGFSKDSINLFITNVLGGKVGIAPFPGKVSQIPEISAEDDCEAIHASQVIEEDDIDLAELMGEDFGKEREEEEEEEHTAPMAVDPEEEAREAAEAERKRRIAEEEIAKLNGASRRRRRRRRRRKRRTEL